MRNAQEGCVHVCACLNRELKARAGGRKVPTWSSLSTQYVPLMQSDAERQRGDLVPMVHGGTVEGRSWRGGGNA